MPYEAVMLDKAGGVATITLNQPQSLNALSSPIRRDLAAALAEVRDDAEVRAVIITGAGRAFCAGGDVKGMAGGRTPIEWREWLLFTDRSIIQVMLDMEKPIVAAVNGYAVGAGCNVALASDIIIAADNARFAEIFVRIGLAPDGGGAWTLPRRVGLAKAKELAFTGEIIDAAEAYRIGMVNRVVPADKLMDEARAFAQRLANGPTRAIGLCKRMLTRCVDLDFAAAMEYEAQTQAMLFQTEDHKEGVKAFMEKREPQFKGR